MIMTRVVCDRCGRESAGEANNRDAPVTLRDTLRRQGWEILPRAGGDFCPTCADARKPGSRRPAPAKE